MYFVFNPKEIGVNKVDLKQVDEEE
jgi:hypothetical protein